ncbi:Usherin [Exaiptasia diaphana]|nr:Usherin [Exaiptasia diaphana]
MLMLAEAGRSLNKNLESLFRHNNETSFVLERLVREIHSDKELCSYMFLNHPGSEDMLWGLLKLLDSNDSRFNPLDILNPNGRGMNSAFAIGRLCDLEAGCARILAMPESKRMIMSLIGMLGSEDIGSAKNACFALSCIASFQQGHSRLLAHPEIDTIVNILSRLLSCTDDELIWFAAMMLRTIGSQKNGCLYLRTQECVKPALAEVLQRQNVKKDTLEEVEDTLALLEKLPKPKPPTLIVESAYSIIINWEVMNPRSGLDVTYQLHQGDDLVYEGYKSSYIANNLTPVTTYSFCVRAYTEGDDGHTSKVVSVQTPESVPSAPQLPRVVAKTTNQIKIMWDPPEQPNGILKAYQVVTRDMNMKTAWHYDKHDIEMKESYSA